MPNFQPSEYRNSYILNITPCLLVSKRVVLTIIFVE